MDDKVFVRDSELVGQSCAKLYLDSKTADVSFIFPVDADYPESIVAHKNLLSAGSPVFDAMFYGSLIEGNEIPIVDASPGAFKEFLQFFYMNQVQLTSENIGQVINLCKKYELTDGVKACEIPLQKSLTNDDICWGYEVAILFELDALQKFCEERIKMNAHEIIKSESFLECNRKSLDKILQLVQSNCSAQMIFEACIDWAKAENERNNIESNGVNIRAQLGDLFDRIPFSELTMEQVLTNLMKFIEIFSDKEIETITRQILNKQFQSSICANLPLSILPKLNCNRCLTDKTESHATNINYSCFESNKNLLLTEFDLPQLISTTGDIQTRPVFYILHGPYDKLRADIIFFEKITLTSDGETHVILPQPVFLQANLSYAICVIETNYTGLKEFPSNMVTTQLEKFVELDDDIRVTFHMGEIISRLVFQKTTI